MWRTSEAYKKNEYPDFETVPLSDVSDSDKEKYKFFSPKFLTCMEWSLENVEETIETYFGDEESNETSNDCDDNR